MTDLERLDEALEALALWDEHGFDWKEARNRYESTMAVVRAYRNLVANGADFWYCQSHQATAWSPNGCWVEAMGPDPCRMAPARLVLMPDPPGEEE